MKEISENRGFQEPGKHRMLKGRARQRGPARGVSFPRLHSGCSPMYVGYVGICAGTEPLEGDSRQRQPRSKRPGSSGSVLEEGRTGLKRTTSA